mgnify:CR=1 FL=1
MSQNQSAWAKLKGWLAKNDMTVIPQCIHTDTTMPVIEPSKSQNATVGRITQLTCVNEQKPSSECKEPVRPIAEKIKSLQLEAARKRRLPQVKSKPKRHRKGVK